VFYVFIEITIA